MNTEPTADLMQSQQMPTKTKSSKPKFAKERPKSAHHIPTSSSDYQEFDNKKRPKKNPKNNLQKKKNPKKLKNRQKMDVTLVFAWILVLRGHRMREIKK